MGAWAHEPIKCVIEAVAKMLKRTNDQGRSAKDVAMYNTQCRKLIANAGGVNVAPPPDNWRAHPGGKKGSKKGRGKGKARVDRR